MSGEPKDPAALDFRQASSRLVAALTRVVGPGRLDLAEDASQDALLRALRVWPVRGTPADPTAWLLVAARNALIDRLRREKGSVGSAQVARAEEATVPSAADIVASATDPYRDDALRMLFLCCRPELPPESRVPLALKECGGFGVTEIAAALRVPAETIAQRLVRAKRRLRDIRADFAAPDPRELPGRSEDVRTVIYAMFGEGWRPSGGTALVRVDLVIESVRLVRELDRAAEGRDPATAALAALLGFHAARLPARATEDGLPITLAEQDRSLWDRSLIAQACLAFERSLSGRTLTRWHVEASIASLHAMAPTFEETDWRSIVDRYDQLLVIAPSPIVRLNRLVALAMSDGPEPSLTAFLALEHDPAFSSDPSLPATRAWLLERARRFPEAAQAWSEAALLSPLAPERLHFQRRALAAAATVG